MIRRLLGLAYRMLGSMADAEMTGGLYAFSQAFWETGVMLALLGVALDYGNSFDTSAGDDAWGEGGDPDGSGGDGGGD